MALLLMKVLGRTSVNIKPREDLLGIEASGRPSTNIKPQDGLLFIEEFQWTNRRPQECLMRIGLLRDKDLREVLLQWRTLQRSSQGWYSEEYEDLR